MLHQTLFVVLMQYQVLIDPVRSAQVAELATKARIQEHEDTTRRRADAEWRLFEQRFNTLVKAVELFGKRYNDGKGHLWPKREADELRRALAQFQELPAFRAKSKERKR